MIYPAATKQTDLWKLIAVFALFIGSGIGCKHPQKQVVFEVVINKTDTLDYTPPSATTETEYLFKNTSDSASVRMVFYCLDSANYTDARSMLQSVLPTKGSAEDSAVALWQFVCRSGFHFNYPYNHQLKDNVDPISLATFPFFMCGEKAGILANLARLSGFNARVVGMDGHVVAEIEYHKKWHLFDADENCVFKNSVGEIANVEELHQNPAFISSKNSLFSIDENFHGYSNYKKYLAKYKSSWIDTSGIIDTYLFPASNLTLYPQDQVRYIAEPTDFVTQLKRNRYTHNVNCVYTKKINLSHSNLEKTGKQITLHETFPYYLKKVTLRSDAPQHTTATLVTKNRITGKNEDIYLGRLESNTNLVKVFNAPIDPEIYYEFKLRLDNYDPKKIHLINIQYEFEVNSQTFALHQSGRKVIVIDSCLTPSLLFQIKHHKN